MSDAALNARVKFDKVSALLVDDNPQGLDILAQIVAGFGVRQITRAGSGEEAQAALGKASFDLIITDGQMPGIDGYELIRWLRREGPQPNRFAPVIIVTGHTRKRAAERARDCGANFVVTKPLVPRTLMERILFVAGEDRMFIECEAYCGPDRRFKRLGPPPGVKGRRAEDADADAELGDATTPNLSQDEINALLKPTRAAL